MKPGTIWRKTIIFSWIRLGLGLLTFFVCLMIGGIAWLVIRNTDVTFLTSVAIGCGAFLIAVGIYFVLMSRFGYSIKMGQLAIVERAHRGESVPQNPVEFSKDVVKQRFDNSRKYYSIQRDISTSLRQIVRVIARGFSLDKDTPDVHGGGWLRIIFCIPALKCIDECCLAYALRRNDYEVNAACIDALTIMVQNWRQFIRKATILSIIIYVVCLALFALFFLPGFYLLKSLAINPTFWLGVSFFLMLTVKVAFIDSYTLTRIVCSFLDLSQESTIKTENYKKLDSWSKMYEKLRKAAESAAEKADDEAFKAERAAIKAEREEKQQTAIAGAESLEDAAESVYSVETEEDGLNTEAVSESVVEAGADAVAEASVDADGGDVSDILSDSL